LPPFGGGRRKIKSFPEIIDCKIMGATMNGIPRPVSERSEYESKIIAKWPCKEGYREASLSDSVIFDRTEGQMKVIDNNRLRSERGQAVENLGDADDGTGRVRIRYPASGLEVVEYLVWFVAKV